MTPGFFDVVKLDGAGCTGRTVKPSGFAKMTKSELLSLLMQAEANSRAGAFVLCEGFLGRRPMEAVARFGVDRHPKPFTLETAVETALTPNVRQNSMLLRDAL